MLPLLPGTKGFAERCPSQVLHGSAFLLRRTLGSVNSIDCTLILWFWLLLWFLRRSVESCSLRTSERVSGASLRDLSACCGCPHVCILSSSILPARVLQWRWNPTSLSCQTRRCCRFGRLTVFAWEVADSLTRQPQWNYLNWYITWCDQLQVGELSDRSGFSFTDDSPGDNLERRV